VARLNAGWILFAGRRAAAHVTMGIRVSPGSVSRMRVCQRVACLNAGWILFAGRRAAAVVPLVVDVSWGNVLKLVK